MSNPRDIMKKPVISEKSMSMLESNKYSFYVDTNANKIEIKKAVEELFKVTVLNVNTLSVKGKIKRVGRYAGKTSDRKKAIVTLKEGDKIEIFEGL